MKNQVAGSVKNYHMDGMMTRYSVFMPRLYNFCKSLGMQPGKIIPSRAFCSDESQGYPVILIAKHFGAFPFNHGRVGGIVATGRHGPHAEHGHDVMLIQASHVGYDSESESFGSYRRIQTLDNAMTETCGKMHHVVDWYSREYHYAQANVRLHRSGDEYQVIIDNQLLDETRAQGLILHLEQLIARNTEGQFAAVRALSTAKAFPATEALIATLPATVWNENQAIGDHLSAKMFHFHRPLEIDIESHNHLELNLSAAMPDIVTSREPLLTAAQVNSQLEFDRTYRTIVKNSNYHGRRMLFISGLNIDISPHEKQFFPLTKFVPWAAYIQDGKGNAYTLEQAELIERLRSQSDKNSDQVDLEKTIHDMEAAAEVRITWREGQ
ncbi:MAG: hypothetical protein GY862_04470 [Gammaproteobacteria bacterium]|nr:hypothetical protein [Gammaproteobacteria bacterium]